MIVARRVYLYAIAFAGLGMLVGALRELLEIVLEAVVTLVYGPLPSVGRAITPDRVSFASAVGIIGLVAWLVHWGLAARAVRGPDGDAETRSTIRKLYLYAVLLVGGLTLTFALRSLVEDLLSALFGLLVLPPALFGGRIIPPLATLGAVGVFWAYHAHVASGERARVPETGGGATLRRWCTYVLAFVGLMLLLFGTANLLTTLADVVRQSILIQADSGRWLGTEVAGRVGSMVAGLVVWGLAWAWSLKLFAQQAGPDPERDSVLRRVYLYLVLLLAVTWTVWSLGEVLYVALRSLLGPPPEGTVWSDVMATLQGGAANALVFGLAWAYHGSVVKREAASEIELHQQASVRWIYSYLVAFVGTATLAVGMGGALATLMELIVLPASIRPDDWWAERSSLYATLLVVGLPVWLIPWRRLQREITATTARRSLVRRIYLFLVVGLSVLGLLGSGAFTLYQFLRLALGESWSGSQTSDLIDAASAAMVAVIFLAYYLRVFQRDALLARGDVQEPEDQGKDALVAASTTLAANGTLVTLLVVQPGRDADLAELQRRVEQAVPPGSIVQTATMTDAQAHALLGGDPPDSGKSTAP